MNVSVPRDNASDTSPALNSDIEEDMEEVDKSRHEKMISLSDHEPVISTIYIKKWNIWWPYL